MIFRRRGCIRKFPEAIILTWKALHMYIPVYIVHKRLLRKGVPSTGPMSKQSKPISRFSSLVSHKVCKKTKTKNPKKSSSGEKFRQSEMFRPITITGNTRMIPLYCHTYHHSRAWLSPHLAADHSLPRGRGIQYSSILQCLPTRRGMSTSPLGTALHSRSLGEKNLRIRPRYSFPLTVRC